jgi:DnaD/phage-associated family protein|nr:MAG TPA: Replication initiation and membrane attachment [Bacteriophage sp.]
MNYLLEINAFERKMRESPLPIAAQLMWYKLMQFCNGLRWPETFQLDTARLSELMVGSSKHTVIEARRALIEAGFLEFKPGSKKCPSTYKLISQISVEPVEPEPLPEEPTDTEFLEVDGGSNDIRCYFGFTEDTEAELHKIASLLYQEFLPDKRPSADDERRVFLYCMEQIGQGADRKIEFPERRKELLAYAFGVARTNGSLNWGYIDGIYRNFHERGIQTVEDAYRYDGLRAKKNGLQG